MPQGVSRESLDVFREGVVTPAEQCQRACRLHDADGTARARPVRDVRRDLGEAVCRRLARCGCERDGVAHERGVDVGLEHGPLQRLEVVERQSLSQLRGRHELPVHDRQLLVVLRVADDHLEHEAVDLGLRQRVRPLGLDRVLRRHHEERVRDGERLVADRDLVLLHDLEQRRLHLRRRAVDLVGEEEVAEHGTELGLERPLPRPVDPRPDEVGRHEVGRELDARERPAENAGRRLDGEGLREARHALDEQMPVREQADEHSLQHLVLPRDDPPDLEQCLLELLLGILRRRHCDVLRFLGHVGLLGRFREAIRKHANLSFG